jgi:hypothetical protein
MILFDNNFYNLLAFDLMHVNDKATAENRGLKIESFCSS